MSTVLVPANTAPVTFLPDQNSTLTIKQKSFADNYLETRNGLEAAKLAGYDGNDATLRAIASENLTKPNIRAYLEEEYGKRVIGANEVLDRLSTYARHDVLAAGKDSPIQAKDALKALELAGKFYKHWDSTPTQAPITVNIGRVELSALLSEALEAGLMDCVEGELLPGDPPAD